FWQREYAGRADIVGQSIRLDGHEIPIGGVTPKSFYGVEVGRQFDVAVPICSERQIRGEKRSALQTPDWWWLAAFGRLKPGVTVERANTELKTIATGVFAATVPPGYTPGDAKAYLA